MLRSQSSHIQNIELKKPVLVQNTMIETDTVSFQTDLALAYNSFGYCQQNLQILRICILYTRYTKWWSPMPFK